MGYPPDGRKQWLLNLRDWDFNWQDQFGTLIRSAFRPIGTLHGVRLRQLGRESPQPEFAPKARDVGPGMNDEMAGLHVQSIPVHMEELPELGQALWGAVMRSVGGSFIGCRNSHQFRLIPPKSGYRVNPARAHRGREARNQRGDNQCGEQTRTDAATDHRQTLAQHQHFTCAGAESHANSNFRHAPVHQVREKP